MIMNILLSFSHVDDDDDDIFRQKLVMTLFTVAVAFLSYFPKMAQIKIGICVYVQHNLPPSNDERESFREQIIKI